MITRRTFLGGVGGAATLLAMPGCGSYAPESCGEAYRPWEFPAGEQRPEYLAVAAALLAASPHNTQPWSFAIAPGRIDLFADLTRSLGAMDGLQRELHVGLGCALENLLITARQHGRQAVETLLPDPADQTLVAAVALSPAAPQPSPLYQAIGRRHTNRGRYLEGGPPPGLEAALLAQLGDPGVRLTVLATPAEKQRFRDGTIEATRTIVETPEMNEASHAWYRHGCAEIERHRDGLTLDATGQGSTIRFLGKVSGAPSAAEAGRYWLDATRGWQTTGSAFCILSTPDRYDRTEQLRAGRAFQRLHLWACGVGLAIHPLNQLAELQDREHQLGLAPRFTVILEELIGSTGAGAQMIFRIGYPWDEPFASPRRPIEWVQR